MGRCNLEHHKKWRNKGEIAKETLKLDYIICKGNRELSKRHGVEAGIRRDQALWSLRKYKSKEDYRVNTIAKRPRLYGQ